MGAGQGQRRRANAAVAVGGPVNVTVIGSSGFDPSLFEAPDIYSGTLAELETVERERSRLYDDDDKRYSHVDGVRVAAGSVSDVLHSLLKQSKGAAFVSEVERNPHYFYGLSRACHRFKQDVENIEPDWDSEGDYYGDRVTKVDVGPDYDAAVTELGREVQDFYDLSRRGENDKIIEEGLLREYGRLIPQLAGKKYELREVVVGDVVQQRVPRNSGTLEMYEADERELARSALSRSRVPVADRAFAKRVLKQPVAIVEENSRGRYDIVDGHHRFTARAKQKPRGGKVPVLVAV